MDEKALDEWEAQQCQLRIQNHGQTHDDEDEDDDRHSKNIETLLSRSEGLVEGPHIFKRVKFLTRWEDRVESRGRLIHTIGNIRLWRTSFQGVASMANFQMQLSIWFQLHRYRHWIFEHQLEAIAMNIGFAGHSREQSLPIVILTADSKRIRRRAMKVLKLLAWLGTPSRYSILFPLPSVLFGNREWETLKAQILANRNNPVGTEALRRLADFRNCNPTFQPSLE
jgi:hypothetical protein